MLLFLLLLVFRLRLIFLLLFLLLFVARVLLRLLILCLLLIFDPVVAVGPGFVGSAAAAADLFDPSAAAAAVVDLSDLSAADPSVAAADPCFVGSAVFAAGLACPVCSFAVALVKEKVVAVPFLFFNSSIFFLTYS